MHNTDTVNDLDALKRELISQAKAAEQSGFPQASEAMLSLLTAADYSDDTLMASAFHSFLDAGTDFVCMCIKKELEQCEATKTGIRKGWRESVDKKAYEIEVFEELKDLIESLIDERVANLLRLRKLVKFYEEEGCSVENAHDLEAGIRDLRTFRENILKGWPCRSTPPSPINKEAIAKAREAIARGERGMRKDEMIWRNKSSDKV
jgi:beta-glucosidase-like glycosyl hydrolase